MNFKWIVSLPKRHYFGSYVQSTLDAVNISRRTPTSIRARIENLTTTSPDVLGVTVYVQEALENNDDSYVDVGSGSIEFNTVGSTLDMQTQVITPRLDGQWMRVRLEFSSSVDSHKPPSVQVEYCY